MYQNLLVETKFGLATVTINRPTVLNALDVATMLELEAVFTELAGDQEIGAVILAGQERAFVAGADIGAMSRMSPQEGHEWALLGQRVYARIEEFRVPVIAAVGGYALGGGCELALACDFRIASTSARFGQPEVTLGICPGWGASQRLPRLVGVGMAKLLILSGEVIDAEEALRIGMVQRVVEPGLLMTTAESYARRILANGPFAVAQAKRAINRGYGAPGGAAFAFEADAFGMCFTSPQQREGMTAFVEKRAANYKA